MAIFSLINNTLLETYPKTETCDRFAKFFSEITSLHKSLISLVQDVLTTDHVALNYVGLLILIFKNSFHLYSVIMIKMNYLNI